MGTDEGNEHDPRPVLGVAVGTQPSAGGIANGAVILGVIGLATADVIGKLLRFHGIVRDVDRIAQQAAHPTEAVQIVDRQELTGEPIR